MEDEHLWCPTSVGKSANTNDEHSNMCSFIPIEIDINKFLISNVICNIWQYTSTSSKKRDLSCKTLTFIIYDITNIPQENAPLQH